MFDWLASLDSYGIFLVTCALLLILALALSIWKSRWRSTRLALQNPPTDDELAEVEALRIAGSFRLSGRTSAPARHFEGTPFPLEGKGGAGATGCYEPTFIESWRDRQSDG
ncbi:MAG: hypothetical protein MPN21_25790 [Thermoanaerobaculia bacterium]|nr:hypothetical protein [Thermoanaerobaculia bacterium]